MHGALCVSYSGLCYASQYCFGRSANRGECAQFCRMKFSLVDAEGRELEQDRYLLSLKDMNQSDHLLELIEAGATSFKIEGRLKDISYVKNVTAAYSQRLNEIIKPYPDKYCRSSLGECRYTFTPDLRKTFNRGYTTYFLHGRQPDIASFDTPKAIGEYVGTVKELRGDSFNVAGVASFTNGDGLCFINADRQLEGFRANRVQGNRIWPYRMPRGLRPGMSLYRNSDQEQERVLSKPSAERKIPILLSLRAVDDGFTLSASLVQPVNHGDSSHVLRKLRTQGTDPMIHFSAEHQQAQKPPHENIIRQLSKLGDTIYTCSGVDIPEDFNFFIPNSLLSEMRRSLIERLLRSGECGVRSENTPATDSSLQGNLIPHSKFHIPPQYPYTYLYNISNKHGGQRPTWKDPLSLVLGDGRRFRLEFDCKQCQMNIYPMQNS